MAIVVQCQVCQASYSVQDHLIGQNVQCKCGAAFIVTAPGPVSPQPPLGAPTAPAGGLGPAAPPTGPLGMPSAAAFGQQMPKAKSQVLIGPTILYCFAAVLAVGSLLSVALSERALQIIGLFGIMGIPVVVIGLLSCTKQRRQRCDRWIASHMNHVLIAALFFWVAPGGIFAVLSGGAGGMPPALIAFPLMVLSLSGFSLNVFVSVMVLSRKSKGSCLAYWPVCAGVYCGLMSLGLGLGLMEVVHLANKERKQEEKEERELAEKEAKGPPVDRVDLIEVPKPEVWDYRRDPSKVRFPDVVVQELSIPDGKVGAQAMFSHSQTRFLLHRDVEDHHVVWDLMTGESVGRTKSVLRTEHVALSPDGKFLANAYYTHGTKSRVDVVSVQTGDQEYTFEAPRIASVAFAGPDHLVTSQYALIASQREGVQYQVWRMSTGEQVFKFLAQESLRNGFATSPGERYLAVLGVKEVAGKESPRSLKLFEVATGNVVIDQPIPQSWTSLQGLAFSSDGQELAAVVRMQLGTYESTVVLVWDLVTGATRKPIIVERGIRNYSFTDRNLEWLPNGRAWLLYGEYLLDSRTGKLLWKVPNTSTHSRVLDDRRIVQSHSAGMVKLIPIPDDVY